MTADLYHGGKRMPSSNITKKALADALRTLMETTPFDKISVAQICGQCGMHRKSFYYHFRDKYDLLNWIFDAEFIPYIAGYSGTSCPVERLEIIKDICGYFYANSSFYRKVFLGHGHNSFSEHLYDVFYPLLAMRLEELIGKKAADEFTVTFFTDAALSLMKRWLMEENCMPPGQFVAKLKRMMTGSAAAIHREMSKFPEFD